MCRYTCIESIETMSVSSRSAATAIATEDFPDAVGPMTATRGGEVLRALPPGFDADASVRQSAQRSYPRDGAALRG